MLEEESLKRRKRKKRRKSNKILLKWLMPKSRKKSKAHKKQSRRQSKSGGRQPFKLYRASGSKKYYVYVPSKGSGMRKVSFGAKGYQDYTTHKSKARRENYRSRHRNDRINDPYAPGFWAYHALWGNSTNLKSSFNSAVRKARQKLGKK